MLNGFHFRKQIVEFAMDICGSVLLHCMFCMLRGQNLAPFNCGISVETLIFLENSHFIEYKVRHSSKVSANYTTKDFFNQTR